MNDLINRQDAIDALNETITQFIPYLSGNTFGIPLEVALAIKRLPSIDAVPREKYERLMGSAKVLTDICFEKEYVVRCKDCKHSLYGMTCPFGLSGGEDFFCAYGEEGEKDE